MILDSRARYQEQSAKDILEEILKKYTGAEGRGSMKNRILLLIWFILLALAAVFYRSLGICRPLLLSALAVVAFCCLVSFAEKDHYEAKTPKAAEQDGIWKGKLQIANESVLPVFLKRQPSASGKSFYWGADGASVFVFP